MSGTVLTRTALGAVGVALGLYGAWLTLSRQTTAQIVSTVQYLVGGVVLNDVLIAAAALVVGVLVTRGLPAVVRAPVVVGAVVLGSTTLLAVPVLLSYGRKPDNLTLLDRDFVGGWWVFAGVVVACVAVAVVVRVRRGAGGSEPA
ncbi:hypothetical protein [Nocardioides rubriscoriae]|uniref:hypothetical protein n=1 Tax=Nocardioides rubriscoriae TaxID=642762 RepID=UPI0011DFC2C3|nr:hypothetical protein [Nocardioides rubriscoriae]